MLSLCSFIANTETMAKVFTLSQMRWINNNIFTLSLKLISADTFTHALISQISRQLGSSRVSSLKIGTSSLTSTRTMPSWKLPKEIVQLSTSLRKLPEFSKQPSCSIRSRIQLLFGLINLLGSLHTCMLSLPDLMDTTKAMSRVCHL
jgi:hypothetical protein